MTLPVSPCGTFRLVSRTSRAFSPKIARSRRSSGVSSVSPLGVTLPTRMSPGPTSAPMRMMPRSSRSLRMSSLRFGMSRVISSAPSLVSRASISCSSMWIEVSTSSFTRRSLEHDRVLEVVTLPGHERDEQVLAERELAVHRRRTVGEHVALLHLLTGGHDRLLVDAGALVRAAELGEAVHDAAVLLVLDRDGVTGDVDHLTVVGGEQHVAGVTRGTRPRHRYRCRERSHAAAGRPDAACWRP